MGRADFAVFNCGSISTIMPRTRKALQWLTCNVQSEPWQWIGQGLAVEPRCAGDIVEAMQADGLRRGAA